jgi:putative oxidoreductase
MNRWPPYLLSILRIIAAFVYVAHGTQKSFCFPAPFLMPQLPPLFLAGGIIKDAQIVGFNQQNDTRATSANYLAELL